MPYVNVTRPRRLIFCGAEIFFASGITRELVPMKVAPKPIQLKVNKSGEWINEAITTQLACTIKLTLRQDNMLHLRAAHNQP